MSGDFCEGEQSKSIPRGDILLHAIVPAKRKRRSAFCLNVMDPRLLQKVITLGGPRKFLDDCNRAIDGVIAENRDQEDAVASFLNFWVRHCTLV